MTVVGSNNGIVAYESPVEFIFTDDAQWRAAITNIIASMPGFNFIDHTSNAQITYGNINMNPITVLNVPRGPLTWTIKATGYADTIVTVTVQ